MVIGGVPEHIGVCLALLIADWRFDCLQSAGFLLFIGCDRTDSGQRQTAPARSSADDLVGGIK